MFLLYFGIICLPFCSFLCSLYIWKTMGTFNFIKYVWTILLGRILVNALSQLFECAKRLKELYYISAPHHTSCRCCTWKHTYSSWIKHFLKNLRNASLIIYFHKVWMLQVKKATKKTVYPHSRHEPWKGGRKSKQVLCFLGSLHSFKLSKIRLSPQVSFPPWVISLRNLTTLTPALKWVMFLIIFSASQNFNYFRAMNILYYVFWELLSLL